MTVQIAECGEGYIAWVQGESNLYGYGRNRLEAMGCLMLAFPETFGVELINTPREANESTTF